VKNWGALVSRSRILVFAVRSGLHLSGETACLPQTEEAQQKDDDDDGAYDVNKPVHEHYL